MKQQQYLRDGLAAPRTPVQRWLALVCLLLAAVVGTAQAVHIHGEWLPSTKHTVHEQATAAQLLGGEERCPLCVAMHSALPPATVMYVAVEVLEPALIAERAELAGEPRWHFAWFSRPPPTFVL
ncbi:MAG: hypothetical protein PW735_01040 [Acidobacteriaceae bacterium]|nr:hypothetical protein [Acidobacteriaceae bacterium]